jgi:tetratricopeptide (TPR) repeat protein
MRVTPHFGSLALILVWGFACPALGADNSDRAAPERARLLFDRGLDEQKAGKAELACALFQESMDTAPASHAALQLGRCALARGELLDAQARFQQALQLGLEVTDPVARQAYTQAAQEHWQSVTQRVPTLSVRPPTRAGAQVRLLRKQGITETEIAQVGQSSAPWPLDPGLYLLETESDGATWRSEPFSIAEGDRMERSAPEPPVPLVAAAGAHTPGASTQRHASRPPTMHGTSAASAWPWIIGGVGLSLIGTGAAFGYLAGDNADDFRARCPGLKNCDPSLHKTAQRARSQAQAANALFVTGGIALAGAVTIALWPGGGGDEHAVALGCDQTGCRVQAGGRF